MYYFFVVTLFLGNPTYRPSKKGREPGGEPQRLNPVTLILRLSEPHPLHAQAQFSAAKRLCKHSDPSALKGA